MKADASPEQVVKVAEQVETLGLKPHVIEGSERTVVAVVGAEKDATVSAMETVPGVARVLPILAPYKVASREVQQEQTVVTVGPLSIGGGNVGVIAGPCSVESREQILESARAVLASGAAGLRGGAFKPRTSPYSFQGLKEEGLKTACRSTRRDRASSCDRGSRSRGRRSGRTLCRCFTNWCSEHAKLPSA